MNIELSNEQLILFRSIIEEYTDIVYSSILDYHKSAQASEEEIIKAAYLNRAAEEEERYNEVKALRDYMSRYQPQETER